MESDRNGACQCQTIYGEGEYIKKLQPWDWFSKPDKAHLPGAGPQCRSQWLNFPMQVPWSLDIFLLRGDLQGCVIPPAFVAAPGFGLWVDLISVLLTISKWHFKYILSCRKSNLLVFWSFSKIFFFICSCRFGVSVRRCELRIFLFQHFKPPGIVFFISFSCFIVIA